MRRQKNGTGPENLQAAQRRAEALALRRGGMTLQQIGDKLGVSAVAIHGYLKAELDAVNADCREQSEQARAIELARLDDIHALLWETIFPNGGGDPAPLDILQLKAVDKILKVMERRSKLLGLDAPVKTALTRTDGSGFTMDDLNEARKMIYGVE